MNILLRSAAALFFGALMTSGALASPAMFASDFDAVLGDSPWENAAAKTADASTIDAANEIQLAGNCEATCGACDAKCDAGCSKNACDSCVGCGDGCDCGSACDCCPKWYVALGAIALKRDRPAPGTVVAANPAGTSFSSASDFSFDWEVGPDLAIARRFSGGNILEARYFGVDSTDTNVFRTPGNFIGAGFTGPTNTLFTGKYLSNLDSTEINLRHAVNSRLSVLGGFRWIELKDEMFYKLNGNVATGDYEYNNRLYGGQLGASFNAAPTGRRIIANIEGKAGVYGNVADGGIFEYQGNNFIGSFVDRSTNVAFAGELGLNLGYRVNRHVVLRSGYQMLWLGDVCLAGEAASRSLLNPSLLRSNRYSDLFYQGVTGGVDFVW